MKVRSSRSDWCIGSTENGPLSFISVYQSATPQIAAVAVVTPRCPKRNAAQTTKGTRMKVVEYGLATPAVALNTTWAASRRRSQKTRPSIARRSVHATVSGATQLSTSGVTMRIPEVSPCHHVHQFQNSSRPEAGPASASGSSAMVGAIAAPSAVIATSFTTCCTCMKR